jgi:hypothetical protein
MINFILFVEEEQEEEDEGIQIVVKWTTFLQFAIQEFFTSLSLFTWI